MIKKALFIFFSLIILSGYSQEFSITNTVIEKKISYKDLSHNKYGKKIFQLLAIDNNTDARKLFLTIKSRLIVRVERNSSNNLVAGISLTPISIDGNIVIKDFAVDSLLWPSSFTTDLIIKNNRHVRDKINVTCTTDGLVNIIDLSNFNQSIGDLTVVAEDILFYYDRNDYLKLEKLAKSISYYYSYGLLLDKLNKDYKSNAVNANPESSELFIQKTELNRVSSYLNRHNMFRDLNIAYRDPVGLLMKVKIFERFRKRAETLFTDLIGDKLGDKSNPLIFCGMYNNLSNKYILASALKQPSEASAFKEVAGVSPDNSENIILETVNNYYLSKGDIGNRYIIDCITNGFVKMAEKMNSDVVYTDALLMLNNTRLISEWFNIELDTRYNIAVSEAISGVASSYLKVGYMALKSGNMEFASNYLNEALSILKVNYPILESIIFPDTSTNELIDIQIRISEQYAKYHFFDKAIQSLEIAKIICGKQSNNRNCIEVDTAILYINNEFVKNETFILKDLISRYQYPDAYGKYNDIVDLITRNDSINNKLVKSFNDVSYSLFLVFLQQGEILIDVKQPEAAMENLLKAKSIQSYLGDDIIEINKLILQCAEPVIMKVIEEGSYRAWANKLEEAKIILADAKSLNSIYFNGSNRNVTIALNELSYQIANRNCLDHQNRYNDALKTAKILLKKGKYNDIQISINKAQETIKEFPECNIDTIELVKFKRDNYQLLDYLNIYSRIRNLLYNNDYNAVINNYNMLEKYYSSNNIASYGIVFHALEDFLKAQDIPILTKEAIQYFSTLELYDASLKYLKLYKNQGGDAKAIKPLTAHIAKQLAIRDNISGGSVSESLSSYTIGNENLKYFKIIYIKNRVVKNSE